MWGRDAIYLKAQAAAPLAWDRPDGYDAANSEGRAENQPDPARLPTERVLALEVEDPAEASQVIACVQCSRAGARTWHHQVWETRSSSSTRSAQDGERVVAVERVEM